MALKQYKPTTPTRRHTVLVIPDEVTKFEPEASLLTHKKYHTGRNFRGKLTVRHKGDRTKRH